MLLYELVRPVARLTLKVFFRKIYITNADCIPRDKPVILAANHPTAFVEPCVLACFLDRDLYFMVRGDIFVKPLYAKLLRLLHMTPMYRLKDAGYSGVKNNFNSLNETYEKLKEGKTIMILAEGTTIHEKRLRPLKKGTARLAFGTLEAFGNQDIYIVPTGVNYTYADEFRNTAMIEFGEPISVLDYKEMWTENPAKATRQITADLHDRLAEKVIIIDAKEDEELVENLFVLNRNSRSQNAFPVVSKKGLAFKSEKRIADTINNMDEVEKEGLKVLVDSYLAQLEALKINDWGLVHANRFNFLGSFAIGLGFVPFILGYVLNYLPIYYAEYMARTKPKHIEFKSSLAVSIGMGASIVWWLIGGAIAAFVGHPILWILVILMPFLGYFAVLYQEYFSDWRAAKRAKSVPLEQRQILLTLRKTLLR